MLVLFILFSIFWYFLVLPTYYWPTSDLLLIYYWLTTNLLLNYYWPTNDLLLLITWSLTQLYRRSSWVLLTNLISQRSLSRMKSSWITLRGKLGATSSFYSVSQKYEECFMAHWTFFGSILFMASGSLQTLIAHFFGTPCRENLRATQNLFSFLIKFTIKRLNLFIDLG